MITAGMVFESHSLPLTGQGAAVVGQLWHSRSVDGGLFMSIASGQWELVIENIRGVRAATLRGPETRPTLAACPPEGEWIGIRLNLGSHFTALCNPASHVDRGITLPTTGSGFWLDGSVWEFPTAANVDIFANRLCRNEIIRKDLLVSDAYARGDTMGTSARMLQRRFLGVVGLPYKTMWQVERARQAAQYLITGKNISDVTFELGYYDQSHLTKSVRRFIGQTPAQLQSPAKRLPLSVP